MPAVMAGRHRLGDVSVLARPAHAPAVHLQDALRAFLAQQARQALVGQPAARPDGVGEVMAPMIGCLRPERDRDRHLRHHGRAAASDQAAVGEKHLRARARRLDRRIHAGAARSNDQDVGLHMHGFGAHAGAPIMGEPIHRSASRANRAPHRQIEAGAPRRRPETDFLCLPSRGNLPLRQRPTCVPTVRHQLDALLCWILVGLSLFDDSEWSFRN
jgi:hypothetical protein